MVVRWRPELWDHEGLGANTKTTKSARAQRPVRVLRPFVVIPTYSFYFAHRGAGDDDREREKEQRGCDLARYCVGVKGRKDVANRLEDGDASRADQDGEQDAGKRAAGNQARAEQRAGAQFRFFRLAGLALHPRAHEPSGENRRRGRNGQVGADRKRERPDAAEFEGKGQEHADEDQPPRQVLVQQSLDDGRHQRGLRCGQVLRTNAAKVIVQIEQRDPDDRRRRDDADDQSNLLIERRRADDVAGFQVLRGVAGVRGGNADDGADAYGDRGIHVACPSERHEEQARQDQRGDGHAGNRVRRGADQTGDARRDGREEEAEDQNQDCGERVAEGRQTRDDRQEDPQQQRSADDHGHRDITFGAHPGGTAGAGGEVAHPFSRRRNDGWNRPAERNQTRCEHGARPDVADIGAPQLRRAHFRDQERLARGRVVRVVRVDRWKWHGDERAENREQWQQHQPRQHASREHRPRDARLDDAADTEIFRRHVDIQRRVGELAGARHRIPDVLPEHIQGPRERFPERAHANTAEDERRQLASSLPGNQHFGARGAFGIGQHPMLLDDERAPPGARKINAGTVNTTPPAIDSPAEPIVWTMLFSRIVEPPSFFSTEIARTAIGIDAATVRPARRPRYTVDAPNSRPNSDPRITARAVNSAGDCDALTYG